MDGERRIPEPALSILRGLERLQLPHRGTPLRLLNLARTLTPDLLGKLTVFLHQRNDT